jgi:hypothetical protein
VFDWIKIVLLVLQLAEKIFDWSLKQGYIQQGRDEEIARAAAALLAKTEYAKNVREKISAMDDATLNAALRDLEPKS